MDESARVRLAKQCLLDLMCGKVPSQEDWGFLFGDPLSTPGLAPSYIQNLKAWARNIAPDPRSKKKPMDQVKIQSLLAEAALNSGRYCLRYAHFPVFSTWTPLTPVSRCLSVFLPVCMDPRLLDNDDHPQQIACRYANSLASPLPPLPLWIWPLVESGSFHWIPDCTALPANSHVRLAPSPTLRDSRRRGAPVCYRFLSPGWDLKKSAAEQSDKTWKGMPGARQFFGMTLYAVLRCKMPPSSGSNENEQTSGASYIDWLCSGRYNWASWMFPKYLLLFRELEWLESKCYDLEIPRRYTEPHRKPLRVPEKARRLFNDWHRQNHIAHGAHDVYEDAALLSAVAARNGEICNPKKPRHSLELSNEGCLSHKSPVELMVQIRMRRRKTGRRRPRKGGMIQSWTWTWTWALPGVFTW